MPLPSYTPCISEERVSRETLIYQYFIQGYTNKEILAFLSLQHNINISLSTLKRILKKLGVRRRIPPEFENVDVVKAEISKELLGSGSQLGELVILSRRDVINNQPLATLLLLMLKIK